MRKPHLLFLALMALASCTSDTLMHSYLPIPGRNWERRDTLRFSLPEAQEDFDGWLYVGLRLGSQFPYREVYLRVDRHLHNPDVTLSDTVRYNLSDEDGRLTKQGGSLLQFEDYALPIHLKAEQTGEVVITHLMRQETLPHVSDVGIRIAK